MNNEREYYESKLRLQHIADAHFDAECQRELSAKYIDPKIEQIMNLIAFYRSELDAHVRKSISSMRFDNAIQITHWYIDIRNYPIGFCHAISPAIDELLDKNELFIGFEELWILRKKVFWIINGSYMHNAIQLWRYLIDPSGDTVDREKPSVMISNLKDASWFKNFESYEQIAIVMESYFKFRVFPNIYFPAISPLYPIICIDSSWKLFIPIDWVNILQIKDVIKRWELAKRFLNNSQFSGNVLPEEYQRELQKKYWNMELWFHKDFRWGKNDLLKKIRGKNFDDQMRLFWSVEQYGMEIFDKIIVKLK